MKHSSTLTNILFIFFAISLCAITFVSMVALQGATDLSVDHNIDGAKVAKLSSDCVDIQATSLEAIVGGNDTTLSVDRPSKLPPKIASFSTSFATSGQCRSHNVILAASHFKWLTIPSGASLSFNEIVGKRTAENGYLEGLVIVGGQYVRGVGGGVCQVSSTLYNAWIRAGLDVISVKAHSLPTSYCQLAQDATVSEWIDLQLFNGSDQDVIVNAVVAQRNLVFNIYGKPLEYDIQIVSRIVETLAPPTPDITYVDRFDPSAKVYNGKYGRFVVLSSEKYGYAAECFIQFFKDGQLVDEKLMRKEFYLPVRGRVLMEKLFADVEEE